MEAKKQSKLAAQTQAQETEAEVQRIREIADQAISQDRLAAFKYPPPPAGGPPPGILSAEQAAQLLARPPAPPSTPPPSAALELARLAQQLQWLVPDPSGRPRLVMNLGRQAGEELGASRGPRGWHAVSDTGPRDSAHQGWHARAPQQHARGDNRLSPAAEAEELDDTPQEPWMLQGEYMVSGTVYRQGKTAHADGAMPTGTAVQLELELPSGADSTWVPGTVQCMEQHHVPNTDVRVIRYTLHVAKAAVPEQYQATAQALSTGQEPDACTWHIPCTNVDQIRLVVGPAGDIQAAREAAAAAEAEAEVQPLSTELRIGEWSTVAEEQIDQQAIAEHEAALAAYAAGDEQAVKALDALQEDGQAGHALLDDAPEAHASSVANPHGKGMYRGVDIRPVSEAERAAALAALDDSPSAGPSAVQFKKRGRRRRG